MKRLAVFHRSGGVGLGSQRRWLTWPFGKWRGKDFSAVPVDYLMWTLKNRPALPNEFPAVADAIEQKLGRPFPGRPQPQASPPTPQAAAGGARQQQQPITPQTQQIKPPQPQPQQTQPERSQQPQPAATQPPARPASPVASTPTQSPSAQPTPPSPLPPQPHQQQPRVQPPQPQQQPHVYQQRPNVVAQTPSVQPTQTAQQIRPAQPPSPPFQQQQQTRVVPPQAQQTHFPQPAQSSPAARFTPTAQQQPNRPSAQSAGYAPPSSTQTPSQTHYTRQYGVPNRQPYQAKHNKTGPTQEFSIKLAKVSEAEGSALWELGSINDPFGKSGAASVVAAEAGLKAEAGMVWNTLRLGGQASSSDEACKAAAELLKKYGKPLQTVMMFPVRWEERSLNVIRELSACGATPKRIDLSAAPDLPGGDAIPKITAAISKLQRVGSIHFWRSDEVTALQLVQASADADATLRAEEIYFHFRPGAVNDNLKVYGESEALKKILGGKPVAGKGMASEIVKVVRETK